MCEHLLTVLLRAAVFLELEAFTKLQHEGLQRIKHIVSTPKL